MGKRRIDLDDELTVEIDHIVNRFKRLGVRNASRQMVIRTVIENFELDNISRKPRSKKVFIKKKGII